MISYICGKIDTVGEGYIILENNGIGYYITMPASSIYKLGDSGDVKVFTYMAVREDDVSLFGFASREELEMFKMLITVSGVGPKGAIGILSSIDVSELKMAIAAEDAKLISGAKGVGAKTAQKIVIELKGKIGKEILTAPAATGEGTVKAKPGISAEAVDVLEALGFSRTSAVRAINTIEITEGMDASTLVGMALKVID